MHLRVNKYFTIFFIAKVFPVESDKNIVVFFIGFKPVLHFLLQNLCLLPTKFELAVIVFIHKIMVITLK